ncbi:MAG TPA: type II secretion system protein GspC [Gammaproteobacteria bacterium]|nr:type II secretion system protein GspC [Gammaproteobacteria bacterium]
MDATLRRWLAFLQHRGPSLVTAGAILLIAWLLAQLTWAFLPQPKSAAGAYAPPPAAAVRQPSAAKVADQHLFGVANPSAANLGNAPDTTLALTLHGIASAKNPRDSRALIVANSDEEPYGVGATVPGGAVIRAIFPDRVMLERDGRMEALRLPKAEGSGGMTSTLAQAPGPQAPAGMPGPQAPAGMPGPEPEDLGQLRQEIASNPQKLMDVVRAMPVQEQGKLTGYRIYPAGNSAAFGQLGLHPGDVVTAVNGIPLTDPAQSMRILSTLKTSEQITVTLLRNGQSQTLPLQLPPSAGVNPDP